MKNSFKGKPKKIVGSITKPGTRYVVNQSKITLRTTENRPKVTTLTGKNTSFRIGLINEKRIVKTMLATASVSQLAKEIVGKNQARIKRMIAVRSNGLSITSSIAQEDLKNKHLLRGV